MHGREYVDDKRIVELFFARDEAALDAVSEKYGALCRNIALNVVGNPLDAEECENDTYMSLWNSIPPQKPKNLSAYVARIARNHAIGRLDYINAQKRHAVLMPIEELAELVGEDDRPREDLAKLISAFLRGVSEDERRVFVRYYFAMTPLDKLAAETGFAVAKLKSMLFRIRNKLRLYLNKEGISL